MLSLSSEEAEAWARTKDEGQRCVAGLTEPYPREKAPAVSACVTKILNAEIKPVTHSPKQFAIVMAGRSEDGKKYANGQLSWSELQERSKKRMTRYFSTASGSYYRFASCTNGVMSRTVLPTYQYPHLLLKHMSKLLAFARQADKEHMAKEDFQIGQQRLVAEFAQEEQSAMAGTRAENAAAWQRAADNFQQMQAIQAQQRASMPAPPAMTTTNCRVIGGNTLNCNTF